MKRRIALLIAAWIFVVIAADSHFYPVGWYVDFGVHWCGIELAPTLGPFCDVT